MNKIIVIAIIFLAQIAHAQSDSTFQAEISSPDTGQFFQFHWLELGWESYSLNSGFFESLIGSASVPTVPLEFGGLNEWLGLSVNRMFYSVNVSFPFDSQPIISASQKSELRQFSVGIRTGVNVFCQPWVVVSPYLSARFFRFRHLTTSSQYHIPIDQYLQNRNIDLRASQFSAAGGLNATFTIFQSLSIGLYAEYLVNLHRSPIINTSGNRIASDIESPVGNWVIGVGIGLL